MAKQPKQEAKMAKKEVAVAEEKKLPAMSIVNSALLEADAGAGMDFTKSEDMATPFLAILQQLSPQVNKRDGSYIQGAEASMILNSATNAVYDGEVGIYVVPALFQRRYVEWNLREQGGGLVRDWGQDDTILESCIRNEKGLDITPQGTHVAALATHYVLLVDIRTGAWERAIISLGSTQLKKSKQWNTRMATLQLPKSDGTGTFTPATFYMTYHLTTVPESNDKGNWFGWQIEPFKSTLELPNGEQIYLAAKAFREMAIKGLVKTDMSQVNKTEGKATDSVVDDEIPF